MNNINLTKLTTRTPHAIADPLEIMAAFTESDIKTAAVEACRLLGYRSLRDLQLEVIVGLVGGNDVFSILPTGYGKSLCYGCLPWIFDKLFNSPLQSIVCVVTPLTAIMEDQVHSMQCHYMQYQRKSVLHRY